MNDDELLAVLGRTIGPDADDVPSASDVAALRALVVATPIPITSSRRWRRRVVVAGVATVAALSGATAVAAGVNDGALPKPARVVARAIGIPVDSVDLADAKTALRQLRTATDAELPDALDGAERAVAALSSDERRALGTSADRTLSEARERLAKLAAPVPVAADEATTTVPASPAPSAPTGTTTATSVDDRASGPSGTTAASTTTATTTGDDDHSGPGRGNNPGSSSSATTEDDDHSGPGRGSAASSSPATTEDEDHGDSGSGSGHSGSGSGGSGSGGKGGG